MRIWTIQPLLVWERLQQYSVLHVDSAYYSYGEGYVPWQYLWLAEQLKNRLPGYGGNLPWWAYCKKPDLRRVRHNRKVGTVHVRIELELPPEELFVMPLEAWDRVHCGDYLAYDEQEYAQWHATWRAVLTEDEYYDSWPRPEPWGSQMHASWERLFDIGKSGIEWDGSGKWMEAVFEPLRRCNVRKVTRFMGVNRHLPE